MLREVAEVVLGEIGLDLVVVLDVMVMVMALLQAT